MIVPHRRGDAQQHCDDRECYRRLFVQGSDEEIARLQKIRAVFEFRSEDEQRVVNEVAIAVINGGL